MEEPPGSDDTKQVNAALMRLQLACDSQIKAAWAIYWPGGAYRNLAQGFSPSAESDRLFEAKAIPILFTLVPFAFRPFNQADLGASYIATPRIVVNSRRIRDFPETL